MSTTCTPGSEICLLQVTSGPAQSAWSLSQSINGQLLPTGERIAEDAETCRLVMLASATLDSPETALWRERALERFRAVRWHEAVGLMMISAAFAHFARENGYYADGKTLDKVRPSHAALALIQKAAPFLDKDLAVSR